jgi:hypothetical protein
MVAASEFPITTVRDGITATQMAPQVFRNGVRVTGATRYCDIDSAGFYTNGDSLAGGVTPGNTGVILSTDGAEGFTNYTGQSNQRTDTSSGTVDFSQYNSSAGGRTNDAATLDVGFIPHSTILKMQLIFSSEEYPEFAKSIYQNFFGVWINESVVAHDMGDGQTDPFNFTYTISNGTHPGVGCVNATSVPCFVAGTCIATPQGDRRAQALRPGDLVMTKDEGAQPLRWIGLRRVAAQGDFAPNHIRADTPGRHRDLLVSPLYRFLIRDNLAEPLFGEAEVLVATHDLVNGLSIACREGGGATYLHLLFDRHQVVFAEGLETESFLPAPQTADIFEADRVAEIYSISPHVDPDSGTGCSSAVRRPLKHYEAELLRAAKVA